MFINMYENATKEELIEKIKQLERHVVQLKNVIAKSQVIGRYSLTVIINVVEITLCVCDSKR